ncbi:replication initiation protein, partial [Enterococcus sp. DIV2472a]
YVVESNDLIAKAKHDLTVNQLKIVDFLISKIQPEDKEFEELETSMYELTNVLEIKRSGRTYNQIANTLDDLRKKEVTIYNQERESIVRTGWVSSAEYFKNGKVLLSFDKKLTPYLLDLSKNYTQYLLIDTVKLKSKYSILLYKLMREADKDKGKSIAILQGTPEEFKEWLGAPKSYSYNSLKNQVLIKAIEEINLKIDDMNLELLQGRYGRKVVQVEIHNNWTVQRATAENDKCVTSISTHDWLNGDNIFT